MTVLAITQARLGSTRLPRKILKTIKGETLLDIHLKRIQQSTKIDEILVATTTNTSDTSVVSIAKNHNALYFRGSATNVLDRFYQAALPLNPEWIVRLTSDCPLVDASLIDDVIHYAKEKNVDYCSNSLHPTYPNGVEVEVFKFTALEQSRKEAKLISELEHVTPFIYKNSTYSGKELFSSYSYENKVDYSEVRMTVDELADFEVVRILVEELGTDKSWEEYAKFYLDNKEIKQLNSHITRNEGYKKSVLEDQPANS